MWSDFKSLIGSIIGFSFLAGILAYNGVFGGQTQIETLFYQHIYENKYDIKSKQIKLNYQEWLRKKIESENK